MKTKDAKLKLTASAAALAVTIICVLAAKLIPLDTTSMKIIGSLVSVFAVSLAAWKFPIRFYFLALGFDIFAAAFGSALNLYRYIDIYDKFVHFLSGILLAGAGMIIISYLERKRNAQQDNVIKLTFAFFFSAACAGFWEIYEFTADTLIGANMQGGNSNTMGDIVLGVLGAAAYTALSALTLKRKMKDV